MAHSIRIRSIYLRNFIGIQTGLGKKELEISFKKFKDKNIILILGDNATGKSTLMSVLHCLPGTTDGRSKYILEDKEGIKKVVYDRSDGCRFECKIVYSPTKTGHSCKGFVLKIDKDGNEEELNENGNITSYKDIVADELGISEAILKLANQNDVCKGHVDMTATERKLNMSTFLPDDIYSNYYAIVDKTYKELKMRINVLVESIGKMHDEDTLKLELERVTKRINDLVEKRDKCTKKIAEFQTRIDVIREGGIEERNRKLNKEIRESYAEIEKIQMKIEAIFTSISLNRFLTKDSTSEKISVIIREVSESVTSNETDSRVLAGEISNLKMRRNSITEQIENKRISIADLETSHSLSELKDLHKSYKKKATDILKSLDGIDELADMQTYVMGYEIIRNIRAYIDSFGDYDRNIIEAVCKDEFREFDPYELQNEKSELLDEKDRIISRISTITENQDNSTLDKRPTDCNIDNCPFIASAYRLKQLEEKLPELYKRLDAIIKQVSVIDDKLAKIADLNSVKTKLSDLVKYVESCQVIISKLPYHEKYSTQKALKVAILKGISYLHECDQFDEYIEKLEDREEYIELINVKIPKLEHDIEILETKGKFIASTKEDLDRLLKEKDSINDDIDVRQNKLDDINETLNYLRGIVDALENFQTKRVEYDSLYDQIIADDAELREISKQLKEIAEYQEKIIDRKDRLKEIDEELNPLTRQRELYKMEQLKIADNKDELDAVNADMFNCEIIRAALSVKDNGIPVGALEFFMDSVRLNANALLSKAFNGNLYLEEFIINTKEFTIPYKKNGDRGMDVSYSSSSERSFISLCLTLSIIEEIVNSYTIICLDEVDRGFAQAAKSKFIEILATQIRRSGIEQLFMITHNYSFYEGYDVGIIAFPGAEVNNVDDHDIIYIER